MENRLGAFAAEIAAACAGLPPPVRDEYGMREPASARPGADDFTPRLQEAA